MTRRRKTPRKTMEAEITHALNSKEWPLSRKITKSSLPIHYLTSAGTFFFLSIAIPADYENRSDNNKFRICKTSGSVLCLTTFYYSQVTTVRLLFERNPYDLLKGAVCVTLYQVLNLDPKRQGLAANSLECPPMARKAWVQSQVVSYQRL